MSVPLFVPLFDVDIIARSYNSITKKNYILPVQELYSLLHMLNWDHPYIGLQAKQGDRGRYWEQVSYCRAFSQDEILHKWKAIFTKGRRSLLLAQNSEESGSSYMLK